MHICLLIYDNRSTEGYEFRRGSTARSIIRSTKNVTCSAAFTVSGVASWLYLASRELLICIPSVTHTRAPRRVCACAVGGTCSHAHRLSNLASL